MEWRERGGGGEAVEEERVKVERGKGRRELLWKKWWKRGREEGKVWKEREGRRDVGMVQVE